MDNLNEKIKEIKELIANYNQEINLNRSYILVNELKKAIKLQDKEIFFLQYKTLITQLYLVID